MKTHLYVIGRADGPVKVGISTSLRSRLAILQTGCPFRLSVLHSREFSSQKEAFEHEQAFHRDLAEYRLVGEWFKLDASTAIECIQVHADIVADVNSGKIDRETYEAFCEAVA